MGNSAHWSSAMRGPWHVAVLMGGWSAERSVSLMSGEGVAKALESRGHKVTRIDMGHDVAARLTETAPDVVFNALHGVPGEIGRAHVRTPVTNAHLVCRLLLENKK